jgi:hypothetical protein
MLAQKVCTDYPVTRRFVPEERSTQPHCLENIKNHKIRQTADRPTLGFHDAHFLLYYVLLPLHLLYFIVPLTSHFLCTFSTVITSVLPVEFNTFLHVNSSISLL